MFVPLFLIILISPEIATAVTLSGSTGLPPVSSQLLPIAYCGDIAYHLIQEAIDKAPINGTVIITQGVSGEVLFINKSLILTGVSPETTLLAPTSTENSFVIKINADHVSLANLSICNKAQGLYNTGIKIMKPHAIVTHCIIHDTPIGIAIWSSNIIISQCLFQNCNDEGIVLLGTNTTDCRHNTIHNCDFIHNCDGIELQQSSDNLIENCRFSKNTHAGIDMIEAANSNNTISLCEFSMNSAFGLYCAGASQLLITGCAFSTDTLMMVSSNKSSIITSSVTTIQLCQNSSLIIDTCDDVEEAHISAQASSYMLVPAHPIQKIAHSGEFLHRLVTNLLSRLYSIQRAYGWPKHLQM
jgi:parallel beta-helix repeat protein